MADQLVHHSNCGSLVLTGYKEAAQHRLHLPGHIAKGLVILTTSFWTFWGVVASGNLDLLLNERSCYAMLRRLTRKP